MKHLEFIFHTTSCTETADDVLSAVLGEVGFGSLVGQSDDIAAYTQKDLYNEPSLKEAIAGFPLSDTQMEYTYRETKGKGWNEEWEKSFFQPIIIDDRCVIHSIFHHDIPQTGYDIVISPQMTFGTGHHGTANLIISELLDNNLQGKSLLDTGYGTSILTMLTRMRGAVPCTAINIDERCVHNSLENIELNGVDRISVFQGDASTLEGKGPFDAVIANISHNILLNDMKRYVCYIRPGSELYVSGFYVDNIPVIQAKAERSGLWFVHHREKSRWATAKFAL